MFFERSPVARHLVMEMAKISDYGPVFFDVQVWTGLPNQLPGGAAVLGQPDGCPRNRRRCDRTDGRETDRTSASGSSAVTAWSTCAWRVRKWPSCAHYLPPRSVLTRTFAPVTRFAARGFGLVRSGTASRRRSSRGFLGGVDGASRSAWRRRSW